MCVCLCVFVGRKRKEEKKKLLTAVFRICRYIKPILYYQSEGIFVVYMRDN